MSSKFYRHNEKFRVYSHVPNTVSNGPTLRNQLNRRDMLIHVNYTLTGRIWVVSIDPWFKSKQSITNITKTPPAKIGSTILDR